ncbi:hypothetical protein [Roseateles sp.]|uniref:hypothetical protein n=1 Tax=Roseateles sp. TaxID=1971397 RepID=UPI002869F957|nr:hypothetical protein [Roseateles sp.]
MNGALPHAIRTARVPARLAGEQRLRQGLERWLAEADPARHGLPGDAIVLVRRLAMRWNTVQAGDSAIRYAPLAALLASARRAASADGDAEAVWFADEAELLGCLARDALAGLLDQRWWWRAALQPQRGGRWDSSSLQQRQQQQALTRWLQAPQQMPRALQRLGPVRARAWLASLGADGISRLVTALAQAYALADELDAWVLGGTEPASPDRRGLQQPARGLAATVTATATAAAAAERLVRICTALLSDASAVASPAGLWRLASLLETESPARLDRAVDRVPPQGSGPAKLQASEAVSERASAMPVHQSTWQLTPKATPRQARDGPSKTPDCDHDHKGDDTAATTRDTPPSSNRAEAHPPAARPALLAEAGLRAAQLDLVAALPQWTDTRHGGLFFLLNAALALGLYGDFTQPRHRGLACPPWRLLLLAGQAWAGPGWRRDPLRRRLIARSAGSQEPLPLPLWPRLHARLAEALGDHADHAAHGDHADHADLPARAQIRRMLALPARLQDRGERLDIFYSLARLPLAVRLAGLDRDPGWIPAAGCDIRFHFD